MQSSIPYRNDYNIKDNGENSTSFYGSFLSKNGFYMFM